MDLENGLKKGVLSQDVEEGYSQMEICRFGIYLMGICLIIMWEFKEECF